LKEYINLGAWSENDIDCILRDSIHFKATGERIALISEKFLSTPYKKTTLVGGIDESEVFVINLDGLDCFTFIDYVEAMRLSGSFDEFKENLKRIRYQSGEVDYKKRNHFFTDWAEFNRRYVLDVTGVIGGDKTKKIIKILNENQDRTCLLQGVRPRKREIAYIPACEMDASVINKMMTGDYVGAYSELPGLDVSHVGIIVKKGKTFLRHASSREQCEKVIDQPLDEYIEGKAGIIILRPLMPLSS
jgi:hypothetical protein